MKRFVYSLLHDREVIQKLWQYFRLGQTTYIAYIIGLINFTLILYRLAGIDNHLDPFVFAVILVIILLPSGIIIGWMHVKKQLPTETKIIAHNNPYVYKVVPFSKESMATKVAIWQMDVSKVMNDFMKLQIDLDRSILRGLGEISGKQLLTDDDEKKLTEIKTNLGIIEKGIDDWKEKYKQLFEGKEVKDIPRAEEYYEIEKNNFKKD